MSPDGRDERREAERLVAAAVQVLAPHVMGHLRLTEWDLRQLSEVRALLEAPEPIRRASLVALAQARVPGVSAPLCGMLVRERAELSGDDLVELFSVAPGGNPMDDQTARPLAGAVEQAYGRLSDEERRRVNPLLERTADGLGDAATAERLRVLTGAVVLTETEALVAAAVNAHGGGIRMPELRALPQVQAIVNAPEASRRACVLQLATSRGPYWPFPLLNVISRKRLDFTVDDLVELFSVEVERPESRYTSIPTPWGIYWEAIRILAAQVERSFAALSADEQERVRSLIEDKAAQTYDELATTLRTAIGTAAPRPSYELEGDNVGPRIGAVLTASDETAEALASAVELFATFPSSGRPPKRWLTEAGRVRGALAEPGALTGALLDAALDAPDVVEDRVDYRGEPWTFVQYLTPANEAFLCGIVVFAGEVGDAALLARLRRLSATCVTMVGGQFGSPRSLRIANASAQAMADIGGPSSITELLALERAIRHGTLLRQIRKAIDALAAAQGLTRGELLERAVERHDLDADGTRSIPLSRGSARLEVDARSAVLAYVDEDGKRRASVPAALAETDADALAGLRDDLKAIRKTLAGESHRLDGLMAADRRWPLADWRAYYLDHPITGRLARALIWGFRGADGTDVVGLPLGATVLTGDGTEVDVPEDAEVRLWHPVHATAEEVQAWRVRLLASLVVQPFKQAFREVYAVTPDERQTAVYSNRFAGHVFGQVQARALMKGRGWKPEAAAWWDEGDEKGGAHRTYEPFGVRAERTFDPILDLEPGTGDLYPFCTSDQVRFVALDGQRLLPLADVPLLVYSEAMRDVDLFVSVTSIGADPDWQDGGEQGRFGRYRREFALAELGPAGEIRRAILGLVLPELPIAGRCALEERFLVVRGDVRTYRIHLGSGHAFMSPHDEYLLMPHVRDARAAKLFLPDDDALLAQILARAFVLANDGALSDPVLTRQIATR